jgi:capsular exopolysaccharide synthesis family protein
MAGHTALRFIRRWLLLLLLGPVLGGVGGYLVIRQVPSVYEATVTLLVGQGLVTNSSGTDQLLGAEQLAQTYAEAIRTRPVLGQAASDVGLSLTFKELLDRVHTRRVPNTQLLRIAAENTDPALAASLANTIAQTFVSKNQEVQTARFASSRDSLGQLVDGLQNDIANKKSQLDEVGTQPASPERDSQISLLQTQLTQLQSMHADTMRSYQDLQVVEARGMNTLTVIEPAVPPEDPIRPNRPLVAVLAVLVGLMLATGAAAIAEYVDDVLRDRQRVALATGLSTLGLVPRCEAGTSLRDPASRRLVEGYRLLRSNILASVNDPSHLRTLLVASPAVGEGKSTTAANLAIVLAESGRRVILVDADMHRPTQMKLFGVTGRRGLSSLLLDPNETASALLRPTWLTNLSVLPAGPTPADPSALLSSRHCDEVITQLQGLCDVVVVDTPPLLAQPDAALLGTRADGVLLVIDASKSRGRQAVRAIEMLRESGAVVLGAVLNRIPKKALEYPSYDSYYASPPDPTNTPPDDGNSAERDTSGVPKRKAATPQYAAD